MGAQVIGHELERAAELEGRRARWRTRLSVAAALVAVTAGVLSPLASSRAAEAAALAPHRIAIRLVNGNAEFYDRVTKKRFVPRGANYHRFSVAGGLVEDRTFAAWDRKRVIADLSQMRKLGYNTVRTALDICQHRCIGSPSGGLRARYLDNLAEFLRLAKARSLRVLIQSNDLPLDGGYVPQIEATCCSSFDGYMNAQYLSPVGYRVYRDYWTTVVRGLIARRAPLDTIIAYGIRGEMFFFADKPPLSLTSGSVRTANGRTYALPAERQQMIADGVVFWLNGMRAAIRKLDPTALVAAGAFAPNDPYPWRPPEDTRVVFMEPMLASAIDVLDVHPYPGYVPFDKLAADFRLDPGRQTRPVVMGEYGGFRFAFATPAAAAAALMRWQLASCSYGVDGWTHWHWRGIGDPEVWTGTEGGGIINTVLSPGARPDPCQSRDFPGVETNLALGQPVTASSEMVGAPGSNAVDGNVASAWISGAGPPGWIEVRLPGSTVKEIRLVVAQYPNGSTVHRLLVRTAAGLQEVRRFAGDTTDGQVLAWRPATPLAGVVGVRVETDSSPSFVAWKEIEAIG
jgi:hypothetical protein